MSIALQISITDGWAEVSKTFRFVLLANQRKRIELMESLDRIDLWIESIHKSGLPIELKSKADQTHAKGLATRKIMLSAIDDHDRKMQDIIRIGDIIEIAWKHLGNNLWSDALDLILVANGLLSKY